MKTFKPWFEIFNNKSIYGEIIVISPDKSVSASFSCDYDKSKRMLTGSLYAIFGLKVADFIITDNSIQVFNSKGDSISIQKVISKNIIPAEVFINCVTYHFPFLINSEMTRLKTSEGELLSFKNYNLLLHNNANYPIKSIYVMNGKTIEAVFNDFKEINETNQPFNILITSGNYKLEVKFKKVELK